MCKEYNGWSNYQTWNVMLWLDNDQESYYAIRDQAEYYLENSFAEESHKWRFANWIKDRVENNNPLADNANMFSDLLGHAIDSVNYDEIADHILDEFEDE
jgi:hypothetical protein